MKVTVGLVLAANAAMFLALAWAADHGGMLVFGILQPFDLASLALIAATLVVAGVGVLAALLALWGYKEIKESAVRSATLAAEKVAAETAEAVAARTTLDWKPSETTAKEAENIVAELKREEGDDGR